MMKKIDNMILKINRIIALERKLKYINIKKHKKINLLLNILIIIGILINIYLVYKGVDIRWLF